MKSLKVLDKFKKNPNILEQVTSKPGDKVSCLRKGTDRIGKIVVKGNSAEEADNLAKDFRLAFKIEVYKNKSFDKT